MRVQFVRAFCLLALVGTLTGGCQATCPATPDPTPAHNMKVGALGQAIPVYGVVGSSATGVVAGAGTYRSDWVDLWQYVGGASFDVAWTGGSGTPAGTLTLEVSNADMPPNLSTAAVSLPLGNAPAVITGNSGSSGVDAPLTGYRWIRVAATVSAGSFTLTALAYPKRIN